MSEDDDIEFIADPKTHPAFTDAFKEAMADLDEDPLHIAIQRKRWTDSVHKAAATPQCVDVWKNWVTGEGTMKFLKLTDADFMSDVESIKAGAPSPRMRGDWPEPWRDSNDSKN